MLWSYYVMAICIRSCHGPFVDRMVSVRQLKFSLTDPSEF